MRPANRKSRRGEERDGLAGSRALSQARGAIPGLVNQSELRVAQMPRFELRADAREMRECARLQGLDDCAARVSADGGSRFLRRQHADHREPKHGSQYEHEDPRSNTPTLWRQLFGGLKETSKTEVNCSVMGASPRFG